MMPMSKPGWIARPSREPFVPYRGARRRRRRGRGLRPGRRAPRPSGRRARRDRGSARRVSPSAEAVAWHRLPGRRRRRPLRLGPPPERMSRSRMTSKFQPRSDVTAANAASVARTSPLPGEVNRSRSWVGREVNPRAANAAPPAKRKPCAEGRAKNARATPIWNAVSGGQSIRPCPVSRCAVRVSIGHNATGPLPAAEAGSITGRHAARAGAGTTRSSHASASSRPST